MRASADRSTLRRRAERVYRNYRNLMILASWLTASERERIDRSLVNIGRLSRARLKGEIGKLTEEIERLRQTLGAKTTARNYELLLKRGTQEDKLLFVQKWVWQGAFFSRFDSVWPAFKDLPPHARIGVDVHGILRDSKPQLTWRLLEATLFEDVAVLWNQALDAAGEAERNPSKLNSKRKDALLRAATRDVFNLLEGYVNGLAVDILVSEKDLNAEDQAKLLEWDEARQRPRPLSLRDKLLQYPKLAIGAAHPVLSESNCAEIRLVLEKEKVIRDALVHPTARHREWRGLNSDIQTGPDEAGHILEVREGDLRESVFFNLSTQEVANVVDAVIDVITRIDEAIGRRFGDVKLWLHQRGADGRFWLQTFE